MKIILGDRYLSYEEALEQLGLETLERRRDKMCLKFSKQCLKLDKMRGLFPRRKSDHLMKKGTLKSLIQFFHILSASESLQYHI